MSNDMTSPLYLTEAALNKIKNLILNKKNPNLKLRIYITGGGCSGFQYSFAFEDHANNDDVIIEKEGVILIVDPVSLQYLIGGSIDYVENLEGASFIVLNPNAKNTCGCGSSFSI